jgi:divalent metal cation (Fe/Co/Zn/Cd) transporter
VAQTGTLNRTSLIRRSKRLEYFTIVWNSAEGLVAVGIGILAGSVSLIAFGADSFIEVVSGSVLLWRMSADADTSGREKREAFALRIVGICFIALALYVSAHSILDLVKREPPQRSIPGIILAVVSLMVMPALARAKRSVGAQLKSTAMTADATQTQFCVYLSAIMLAGLLLNAAFGLWWADPMAALAMVPLIAKEGMEALRGKACCPARAPESEKE